MDLLSYCYTGGYTWCFERTARKAGQLCQLDVVTVVGSSHDLENGLTLNCSGLAEMMEAVLLEKSMC
ncbi:hypothetical protein ACXAT3_003775 [Clostridium sporogenes]